MDLKLVRSGSDDANFIALVALLDKELDERYGVQQEFFGQFNSLAQIKQVVIAYADGVPVGCGAIKEFEAGATEVKRMFVKPGLRGKGIAGAVLNELEKWAAESGYSHTILQTGLNQPEAVALYTKAGYRHIENYGQYAGTDDSICMRKVLQYQKPIKQPWIFFNSIGFRLLLVLAGIGLMAISFINLGTGSPYLFVIDHVGATGYLYLLLITINSVPLMICNKISREECMITWAAFIVLSMAGWIYATSGWIT